MRWAGSAAIVGGLTALAMTPPFATAYFLAYPGEDQLPFWFDSVVPRLDPLLSFASRDTVYETYGRMFNAIYLLLLPLVVVVHRAHGDSPSRLEKRGYLVLITGLAATTIGVAGDYWGNGIGFLVEAPGLLTMIVGVTMWGGGLVRGDVLPVSWAWLVCCCGPGAVASSVLIGHVPSGPTLAFAIVWLVVGCLMLAAKDTATAQSTGGV